MFLCTTLQSLHTVTVTIDWFSFSKIYINRISHHRHFYFLASLTWHNDFKIHLFFFYFLSAVCSSLLLSHNLSHGYFTFCLAIHQLMSMCCFQFFTSMNKSYYEYSYSVLCADCFHFFGVNLRVERLNFVIREYLTFKEITRQISKVVVPFHIPTSRVWEVAPHFTNCELKSF